VIKIHKKNEVYLILESDDRGILMNLSEFFTFEVPGAKFMPAYRNKMWDGKIRLFNTMNNEIYIGLLHYIIRWCKDNEVYYELDEGVEADNEISEEVVKGFVRSLRPKSNGKSISVRDYQISAISHAIGRDRALLLSPTASGKSLIIYSLVRYYQLKLQQEQNDKILILVPTTSLVEQMYSDFIDYGWFDDYIQKVYSGHDRNVTKDVVISTWQSIYKMPTKYFEQFGCVIGDEAHMFKAKSLTSIMQKLHLCKYRFGLTGTIDGTQTHRLVLEGLFGQLKKVVTTKELMDKDTLSSLEIRALVLTYTEEESRKLKDMSYQEEMDYIVSHTKRNEFIRDLSTRLKGNTLVLFQYVEKHGNVLYDMIKEIVHEDRKVFFVFGGTDTETREEIRAITETEEDAIIIASYGTFSTGINIRHLHNIVFASPSKSRIRTLQSIGRGLRRSDNKDSATLYDIADDFTYNDKRNFTLNHFMERINIYNSEEFEYEITRIRIKP
jgi:superfamily II DNA or RNA helicase